MRYYRCKCGKSTAFGSMGPFRCSRCNDCGSDLAEGPNSHRDPRPHSMFVARAEVETDLGMISGPITRCVWCHRMKHEIEKRGEPMVDFDSPEEVARRAREDAELRAYLDKLSREQST